RTVPPSSSARPRSASSTGGVGGGMTLTTPRSVPAPSRASRSSASSWRFSPAPACCSDGPPPQGERGLPVDSPGVGAPLELRAATMRPRHLSINGRFLAQEVTGVQRFAVEVVRALDALLAASPPPWQVELVAPPDARHQLGLRRIPVRRCGL